MALSIFTVARSVKAGGLAGLAALAVVVLAQHFGVPLTDDQAAAIVGMFVTVVTHLVPDSKKQEVDALAKSLNMTAQDLADKVPQVYQIYPAGKNGLSSGS